MKYQEKTFSSKANTKAYRENYDKVFSEEEGVTYNDDGTITIDVELDDDVVEFVTKQATEWNMTFNDTVVKMLEEGLDILDKQSKEEKEEAT